VGCQRLRIGLFEPSMGLARLRPVATGCARLAPLMLRRSVAPSLRRSGSTLDARRCAGSVQRSDEFDGFINAATYEARDRCRFDARLGLSRFAVPVRPERGGLESGVHQTNRRRDGGWSPDGGA
jgi:hypothetical protein